MYAEYFGFDSKPFKPNHPNSFYRNATIDAAGVDILGGIRKRRGLILLTGEAGLGKTLLLRRCMAEADDVRFMLLGNAHLDFPDILTYLCGALGLEVGDLDFERQSRLLLDAYASRDRTVALLVDDAHHLRTSALRRLWDFVEASAVNPEQRLPVVLAGLPDIEDRLRQPELRLLQDHVRVRCRLTPLSGMETGLFIDQQLKAAGHAGGDLLSPPVVERIAHHSHGVPRAIAKLCDTVLLLACLQSERTITPAMVDEAALNCFVGDRAELPGPADLEPPIAAATIAPPIAAAAIAPPPAAEVARPQWSPGILINGLTLAAITTAAIIWLWPSEPVPRDQPPPPYSLVRSPVPGQREYLADPPGASPPVSVRSPVPPEAMPLAIPVPDATESGTPASENRPVLPTETATAPLTPDPVSITQPQAGPEIKPKAIESRADKTRAQPSSAARPLSQATRPQASRSQFQPRVAKSHQVAKFRKGTKTRRGWASTVRYPWEKPTATGFNQK
jgi:general secretion pathway protein A